MKNNLELLRKKAGLTQSELSSMSGVSLVTYNSLTNEIRNPSMETAYRLSVVLGVNVYAIWPNEFEVAEETITIRRIKGK